MRPTPRLRPLPPPVFALLAALATSPWTDAGVTQRTSLRVTADADKGPLVEVVTTVESDEKFPENLELVMNRTPGFMGIAAPVLDGPMTITAPPAPESNEDGPVLASEYVPDAWLWRVITGDARTIRLRYRVPIAEIQASAGAARGDEMVPFVSAHHAMLGTHLFLVCPNNPKPTRLLISITPPEGQRFIPPWPLAADQRPGGPWYEAPIEVADRIEFIPLGDWRGPSFSARGLDISMVFAPGSEDMEAILSERLKKIADFAVRLFGTTRPDRFIMTFRANQPGSGSTSATVGVNTISFVLDPDLMRDNAVPATHTIAHEMFHLWGRHTLAIGGVKDMRWLHEGFTDYYATQIGSRLGLFPEGELGDAIALRIETSKRSPARGRWSITDAGPKGMDGDRPSNDLVYQGGWLLACWLDAAIRTNAAATSRVSTLVRTGDSDPAKPNTLDEFMRDFYNDPRWNDDVRPTPALFMERLAKYLPANQIEAFSTWTREPWAFDAEKDLSAVGVKVKHEQVPAARMNIRLKPGTMEIEEVVPGGAADKLGLLAGDTIIEVNGIPVADSAQLRAAWTGGGGSDAAVMVKRDGKAHQAIGPKPMETKAVIDATLLR